MKLLDFLLPAFSVVCSLSSINAQEKRFEASTEDSQVNLNPMLFECPDCREAVSKRAVMCPHCGCPGEAVVEAVRQAEESEKPKPVVWVLTDHGEFSAVAVREGDSTFVVLDAFLLAESNQLELREVTGERGIPYTGVELAPDLPWMRLSVKSEELDFLPIAAKQGEMDRFLDGSAKPTNKEDGIIALNAAGELLALKRTDGFVPVPVSASWKGVGPKELRRQLRLISILTKEKDKAKRTELLAAEGEVEWLTPYLAGRASDLVSGQ